MLAGFAAMLLFSLVAVSSAAAQVLVEDWSKIPVGTTGLPAGWNGSSRTVPRLRDSSRAGRTVAWASATCFPCCAGTA